MSQSIYLFIAPLLAACLLFAMGCATVISSKTGGHPRTQYWNKIFSGLGYICLAGQGALAVPYLVGSSIWITGILSFAFALFGLFMLYWGLKQRQFAKSKK
ncbi:MAG: hypothetical protein IT343_15470 [Candidatus Melainabacteria bacterium]|jgi:hypothetical protein|nr:hypothetical protein [Candidatus Melainabacteria bacterium]